MLNEDAKNWKRVARVTINQHDDFFYTYVDEVFFDANGEMQFPSEADFRYCMVRIYTSLRSDSNYTHYNFEKVNHASDDLRAMEEVLPKLRRWKKRLEKLQDVEGTPNELGYLVSQIARAIGVKLVYFQRKDFATDIFTVAGITSRLNYIAANARLEQNQSKALTA